MPIAEGPRRSKGLLDLPDVEAEAPAKVEPVADHGGTLKPRRTAAARKAGQRHVAPAGAVKAASDVRPQAVRRVKPARRPAARAAEGADAELAAEIAAIKADDLRKGSYYPQGKRKPRR